MYDLLQTDSAPLFIVVSAGCHTTVAEKHVDKISNIVKHESHVQVGFAEE